MTLIATGLRRSLLLVLMAAALQACTSAPKAPPASLQAFKPELALQRAWSIQADGDLTASPTIDAQHQLVLLAFSKDAHAYSAASGALLWRARDLGLIEAPLVVAQDGKSVLALVQGKEAVSLDAKTGKVLWRAVLPAEMYVQAASAGGVFVVLTSDGRIVGLDEDSGRRRWAIARSIPALSVRGSGTITSVQGDALVGLPGGKVVSIKASNGQLNWEAGLAEVRGVNEVERIADALPDWVSVKNVGFCAAAYRHRITCLDAQGRVSFTQEVSAVSSAVATQSPVMLSSLDESGDLKAWSANAAMGAPATWVFEGLRGRKSVELKDIAAQGDTVFISDRFGFVHGIHAKTGKTVARSAVASGSDVAIALWAGSLPQGASLVTMHKRTVQSWLIASLAP